MSATMQRRMCRICFVLLALAPCCGVLALAAWRHSAQDDAAFMRALHDTFGVTAEWDRLTYPAPGEMRCEGLRLFDGQSRALLAEIELIRVVDRDGNRVISPGVLHVQVAQLARIAELLLELVDPERAFQSTIEPCEAELVDSQRKPLTKATIHRAETWESDGRSHASVTFRTKSSSQDAEIKLSLQRDPAQDALRVLLDTHEQPLSLADAGALWPEFRALGSRAHFSGTLDLMRNAQGWHARVRGNVERIDLDTLVSRRTTQRMSGEAGLQMDEVRFANGSLTAATCRFGAKEGAVGLGLLSDASGWFGFQSVLSKAALANRSETVDYSELHFAVRLSQGVLELKGLCEPDRAPILDLDGVPLLRAAIKPGRPPVAAAVQLFYPTAAPKVAASRESWWLASWLPLPPATELTPYSAPVPSHQTAANPVRNTNEH